MRNYTRPAPLTFKERIYVGIIITCLMVAAWVDDPKYYEPLCPKSGTAGFVAPACK